MKRCPQCNRLESDEALKFCHVDPSTLVHDSSSIGNEAGTAQLGSQSDSSEVHTSVLSHRTDANINRGTGPTAILPPQPAASASLEPNKAKQRKIATIIVVIMTAVVAATSALLINSYQIGRASCRERV